MVQSGHCSSFVFLVLWLRNGHCAFLLSVLMSVCLRGVGREVHSRKCFWWWYLIFYCRTTEEFILEVCNGAFKSNSYCILSLISSDIVGCLPFWCYMKYQRYSRVKGKILTNSPCCVSVVLMMLKYSPTSSHLGHTEGQGTVEMSDTYQSCLQSWLPT